MEMEKERESLVEFGKKLVEAGLTKGTGGNLSIFDRERFWKEKECLPPSGQCTVFSTRIARISMR